MMSTRPADPAFCAGDEVVLTHGTYQGTPGVFLKLRGDVKWADIQEPNGAVRSNPVIWLALAASTVSGSKN